MTERGQTPSANEKALRVPSTGKNAGVQARGDRMAWRIQSRKSIYLREGPLVGKAPLQSSIQLEPPYDRLNLSTMT